MYGGAPTEFIQIINNIEQWYQKEKKTFVIREKKIYKFKSIHKDQNILVIVSGLNNLYKLI